ncbi:MULTISPECIES: hypothetical protein [unclassified Sediminibacterium]|uniref:hypothetical protein n=1 Tax=unclassified Sediminibacterium TaxID=2635961 RepID=UPI00047E2BF9|nr:MULTISPECIES: hypothetical protein [unclassified Sediminibacterium]MDP3392720.1 hypothetical protein [Sediminibacterium sp.]MDP3566037.1 hypothetical protein [Sediminibacterium sp.]
MINQEVMWMIERYHKPAQNVKIKTTFILIGLGIIGVAYIAIKSSITMSKEILELKANTLKNLESIHNLTSKTAMLEYDLQQNELIIGSLRNERKSLLAELHKATKSSHT